MVQMSTYYHSYTLAIIIPCWNCEEYIGALLDSLINQSFSDWNAFLVDDICTDSTPTIIKKYTERDPRIRYYKRDITPKGAQTCRNIGIMLSDGAKYIIFMDSDDLIAPFCFEQRIQFMQTHPDVDFASFPAKAFKNEVYDNTFWGFGFRGEQELLVSLLNWKTLQIFVSTNIYKRSTLIDNKLIWDVKLHSMQDADFNIQALTLGLKHMFADSSRIDYFYRTGHTSVSKRIFEISMFDSHLYFINKVVQTIRNKFQSKYDFYLEAYITNFLWLFRKNKKPIVSLLNSKFVKSRPLYFARIALYYLLGMRGKRVIFKKYVDYSNNAVRVWSSIISNRIQNKIKEEIEYVK